jgi:hypothetical protein
MNQKRNQGPALLIFIKKSPYDKRARIFKRESLKGFAPWDLNCLGRGEEGFPAPGHQFPPVEAPGARQSRADRLLAGP